MVVKLGTDPRSGTSEFESRVILDGSQTTMPAVTCVIWFESRVILDGSQTYVGGDVTLTKFESRVILDGSQTGILGDNATGSV